MPQLSKGGKFVFGWSEISGNGRVRLPDQAVAEYRLQAGSPLILISGSKTSGAFSVSTVSSLEESRLVKILEDIPELWDCSCPAGAALRYKNRYYCWVGLDEFYSINLPDIALAAFAVRPGDRLLAIRGSNLAFDFAVKGPLVDRAMQHTDIKVY